MGIDEKQSPEVISMRPLSSPPNGELDDPSLVKQTRTRRLFSAAQLFALNLAMYGTWYSVATNIYFAMQNGGPRGWLFSYVLVSIGVSCQALSFAEMSSIMPLAGAQYYWTYHCAPPSMKRFLTWIQGWTTWLGYVSGMASVVNGMAITLQGIIGLGQPEYTTSGWRTTLLIIAYLLFLTLVNMYAFRIVPWFEMIAGILNIVVWLVVLIMLWVLAPRNNMDFFLRGSNNSGWGDVPAFHIGALSNIYLFVTFESSVHIGEETRNPRQAVPQGMFWGFFANAVMGLLMIFTFGITMPEPDVILSAISPIAAILHHATGSTTAAITLISLIFFSGTAGSIGILSSVSRLTWAWARDGGLPKYFAHVDGSTRVPARAVWGTAGLVVLLGLLNLNDQAFIALGAVHSLCSLAAYVSYIIALSVYIYARVTTPGGIELGEWNCGRWGLIPNILGLVYTVYMAVWLPFPNLLPVTAANMNYAGPVYLTVIIGAISWWFISAKNTWPGPNMKIVEIVLRSDADSK